MFRNEQKILTCNFVDKKKNKRLYTISTVRLTVMHIDKMLLILVHWSPGTILRVLTILRFLLLLFLFLNSIESSFPEK